MKALVIGPKNPDFDPGYNRAITDALKQVGYRASCLEFFVSTPPGFASRVKIDLARMAGIQTFYDEYVAAFNASVSTACETLRPDIVLVIRGSKIKAETLEKISALKILWCHDVVRRCDLTLEQLRAYDRVYVFDRSDLHWLAERRLTGQFLPLGVDPRVYFPRSTRKDIDVFFVGAYYPDRRETLEFLADSLPRRSLRFYGRHVKYREPTTWTKYLAYRLKGQGSVFVNRSLNAHEISQFYRRSKICINMHHSQNQFGCNPRVFEIMASGSFQICDNLAYVLDNFGSYVETYKDRWHLKDLILANLDDEEARESKAKAAEEFVFGNHTFKHRITDMLADCEMPNRS
ncbi:glycosyltransferase [Bradyrhizobium sp. Tv2a-2]|uniref:CgeB family protein n=1 Tax=Bradyrhizobium sp. Tv2a-2 TaxID=113395 RepID=UPI0005644011|nr:glycosyltransferase [Bradyrhizobium sp. Tv2a-2]